MKIGLLGAESTHAAHFCETVNRLMDTPHLITHLFGDDNHQMEQELAERYNLTVCGSAGELIDAVDAVVIVYRMGSLHYGAAMAAMKAGKPVFVDKPFTTDLSQAQSLVEYAESHGCLLCGGSNLKQLEGLRPIREAAEGSQVMTVSFAADPDSPYEGFWFYGSHSVELCLELYGEAYTSVSAFTNGSNLIANIHYPDKLCVIATSSSVPGLCISLSSISRGKTMIYPVPMQYQQLGPREFLAMLDSGKLPRKYDFYVTATRLIHQIMEAAGLNG